MEPRFHLFPYKANVRVSGGLLPLPGGNTPPVSSLHPTTLSHPRQPLKPTHLSSFPSNHPPPGPLTADLDSACFAVTGPGLPGELAFGEFPGGGGRGGGGGGAVGA